MNQSSEVNETAEPRRRVVPRLNLRVLLLLFIPVGLSSLWLRESYLDQLPIDWQEFSTEACHQQLKSGHTVLVFQYHDWDIRGHVILKETIETPEVRRAIRKGNVVPFLVSDRSKYRQLRQLLPMFRPGHTTMMVCHPSAPRKPIVVQGVSTNDVIDAIYGS